MGSVRRGKLRYLSWIITVPIGVALVLFAVSNEGQVVTISLWPLPFQSPELPVYSVVLIPAVVTFFAGGFVAWVNGGRYRRLARQRARQVNHLRAELNRVQASKARVDEAMARVSESARLKAASAGADATARRELPTPSNESTEMSRHSAAGR